MRIVSEAEVRRTLEPAKVIAAIEEAFRNHHQTAVAPTRLQQPLGKNGTLLLMPCYDSSYGASGLKIVTVSEQRPGGGDRVQATYLLLDVESGQPELLVAANYFTDLRTAATSALATKYLTRPHGGRTLGIFGTGRQARAHAAVLSQVMQAERMLVCGSSRERSSGFARQMSLELGIQCEAADAATCAAQSDVICTCTTSAVPLFAGALLRPGTHLNLVGAFQPHTREVDQIAIQRARVVVDTYDGALAEAGDLILPLQAGAISREHLLADLHELVSGKKIRESEDDITIFKSVGCALEDLATAVLLRQQLSG